MSKVFVVFIIALLFSFYSNAQSTLQYKPQMIMHRVDDTTKGASGWYYAQSTGGNFSVSLPTRFSDYTIQEATTKRVKKIGQMHVVGGRRTDGVLFSVTKMPKEKGKSFEALVKDITTSISPAGTVSDMRKEKYQNHNSIYVTTTKDTAGGITKYIELDNNYVMVQSIAFTATNKKAAKQCADRFFSSLKILGK